MLDTLHYRYHYIIDIICLRNLITYLAKIKFVTRLSYFIAKTLNITF